MQYDALAPMYDRLMDFVEYDEWVGLILRAASRYGASRRPDILEIGAGTGVVGSVLDGMGFRYTASDLSFPMCKEARGKRGLATCAADARNLPFKKQFGMAIFLYDGINYLLSMDDYRKLFSSVYDILAPEGLFLFDITTRENSLRHFTNYLDFEDYGDMSFVRHSYFDARKSVQHNDFTIYRRVDDGNRAGAARSVDNHPPLYEKFVENHRQKLFSVGEIEKSIPKKRFDVLGIWDGYTFRKYSSRSIRVHFLLRKIGG